MAPESDSVASFPPAELLPPREAEALLALHSTRISSGTCALLITGFLLISLSGMVTAFWQSVSAWFQNSTPPAGQVLGESALRAAAPAGAPGSDDLWRSLPSPAAIRKAVAEIEERSMLAAALRPRMQAVLLRAAGMGNEQVEPAPDGWLFFRRDLDYLNGRPFLDRALRSERARGVSVAPDSVAAISEFHNQLASRGIRLLVVPVPVKPCIERHRLRPVGVPAMVPTQNASHSAWLAALQERGVSVFDPGPLLLERVRRTGEPQFLRTDTHWTPEAMEAVAEALAFEVERAPDPTTQKRTKLRSVQITAHGDTVALLGLAGNQGLIAPQTVTIRQPLEEGTAGGADPGSDVLLLGDSFSNIYSLGAMGWGEGAGLAEHLGVRLGRRIDSLVRNSDGAFATRQMLQRELASGHDRLAGKRLVIWEFAVRELAFGDWKSLPIAGPATQGRTFFCPPPGVKQRIRGVVAGVAALPRAGTVPYKEHIVAVHLVDVLLEGQPAEKPLECVLYTWSLREQRPTPASRLRSGETVFAEIQPWEDVSDGLEKFQRSELEPPELLLEPATWAEVLR